jgi:hypothetical protein
LLFAPFASLEAWALEELSDQELSAVTAGSADPSFGGVEALTRIPFRYASSKGEVDGEVFVMPMTDIRNQGTLQLMDNAQSNLRSLININAVNSPVQILLNLNINIHSTIGNVNQLNYLLSQQGL